MKKTIIILIVLVIAGIGIYLFQKSSNDVVVEQKNNQTEDTTTKDGQADVKEEDLSKTVIGKSVEGRDITAYHYYPEEEQDANKELLFIGGIHGGYSWNTILVAYEMMDYLEDDPSIIPSNVKVTIIPSLNPDGQNKVVGTAEKFTTSDVPGSSEEIIPGRFNANDVDLNRNFDCDWQANGVWQNKTVSGGSEAFSEPESAALKDYIDEHKISAVVAWYSSLGGVFTSNCHNGVLPETENIASIYSKASGYKKYADFDFYKITGDMVNWFSKEKIPAISVLLTTHEDTEWNKNKKGIDALLEYYAK